MLSFITLLKGVAPKMARTVKPLTATEVKNAKPKEKIYRLFDGGGLYLEVQPAGGKWWRLKYRFNGKESRISLGTYPTTSLADARQKRDVIKGDMAKGIDPTAQKKQQIQDLQAEGYTFKEVAEKRLDAQYGKLSETHIERTRKGFKMDVYDAIGDMPIELIMPADVIRILNTMRDRNAAESARKVFYAINKTFKWAVSSVDDNGKAYIATNPCRDIDVGEILGAKSQAHYPIITDNKGLKALMKSIDEYSGHYSTKMALKILAYTFVRPYNIRHAEWSEIDFDEKKWYIPGSKMKTKRDHIVPLADTVVELLRDIHLKTSDSNLIFPSSRGKNTPMSDAALVNALRRMGYEKTEIVAHSFRGIFSTITHEKSGFPSQVIEIQLAHSVGNSVSRAYNRAEYLDDRIKLMQWWANYLDQLK